MTTLAGVELFDLSPAEAMWLVAPDAAWLYLVTQGGALAPLRNGPRTRCYRLRSGTPVHVLPECRCRR